MDISHVTWHKSTYSGANGGDCVEVASTGKPLIAVRDSKDPDGPKLAFASSVWRSFVQHMRDSALDAG